MNVGRLGVCRSGKYDIVFHTIVAEAEVSVVAVPVTHSCTGSQMYKNKTGFNLNVNQY